MSILPSLKAYYYEAQARLIKIWWDFFNRSCKMHCDVLMFHHVTDGYVDEIPSCHRTRREFIDTLQRRIDSGVEFICMDEVSNLVFNDGQGEYATVTFDDVPDNFLSDAYPILKELKIPFTLFLTISYLDKPGYINKKDLAALIADPLCTIGAHTLTHPMLRKVKNSFEEISESKKILEKLIGREVKYLAYPFGRPSSISHKITRQAKKAGFVLAFGTIFAPINKISKKSKFYLPRVID